VILISVKLNTAMVRYWYLCKNGSCQTKHRRERGYNQCGRVSLLQCRQVSETRGV